jgi:hypothetical protein
MARGLRVCPICPACGAKKFRIVSRNDDEAKVTVECLSCSKRVTV